MNKIKEILLAYATKINPTEEQKEVAEKRLEICMANFCYSFRFIISGKVTFILVILLSFTLSILNV